LLFCSAGSSASDGNVYWRESGTGGPENAGSVSSNDAGSTWTVGSSDRPFRVYGVPPSPVEAPTTKRLLFFCHNEVYHGTALDSMSEFTDAAGDINIATRVSAFEAEQKAFVVNGSTLKVADYINAKITTADVGANPPDRGNLLTGGTSGAKMIVDYADSLTGATTIYGYKTNDKTFSNGETVTGTDDDGNAISFATNAAEDSAPHWYTWTEYGGTSTNMPDKSTVSCFWRGRAVVVDDDNPTQFHMSRIGNLWDFDADTPTGSDALRPVYGALGDTGKPGDVIRALIPFNDTYLIFACSGTIYLLVNDPAAGGQIGEIKGVGGIIDSRAWTWDDKGNLYILTHYGLMRVPKGFGSFENLTEEKYPNFVSDLAFASATDRIVLQYDVDEHGLVITKTNVSTYANTNYFYDPRTGGLFIDTYPTTQAIYCGHYFNAAASGDRKTLYGCQDGYLRYFSSSSKDDDGTAISSYIDYGPIPLADGMHREGVIHSVQAELGGGGSSGSETDSDPASFKVWVDDSADGVVEKMYANTAPNFAGTFKAPGRGRPFKRKAKGLYAGIKLYDATATKAWSLEKLIVDARPAGRAK